MSQTPVPGPSGPHITPDEWNRLARKLFGQPDMVDIYRKILAYQASRDLHAARDPRINDPFSIKP